jgi:hydroxyethylthiazole kinase-like sugar kinase family protein
MYPGGAANKVGHMYLWGIVNTAISAGAVVGGFLSSLATLFTALLTALTVDGGSAKLSTYTKATNVATFVTAMVSRSKVSGFSKRTAPIN